MVTNSRRAAAISMLGLVVCVLPAGAVKLQYKVQEGDSWTRAITFKGTGTITGQLLMDLATEVETTVFVTVTSAGKDGTFICTLDPKIEKVKVTTNGEPVEDLKFPAPQLVTLTVAPTGKVTNVEIPQDGASQSGIDLFSSLGMAFPQFPETDLKPGDTWEATPATTHSVKVTGTLVSVKEVDGKQVAEVEYLYTVGSEAMSPFVSQLVGGAEVQVSGLGATGTLTTQVDLATGVPGTAKGSGSLDLRAGVAGMEVPVSMKTEMEVKEEKKDEG